MGHERGTVSAPVTNTECFSTQSVYPRQTCPVSLSGGVLSHSITHQPQRIWPLARSNPRLCHSHTQQSCPSRGAPLCSSCVEMVIQVVLPVGP